jgi:hypothetical protein
VFETIVLFSLIINNQDRYQGFLYKAVIQGVMLPFLVRKPFLQ